ncbi:MAG: DUF1565 domain-containing protein, partial [Silvibacterium sp.]
MSHDMRSIRHGKIHGHASPLLVVLTLLFWCGAFGLASAATLCVNPGGTSGCKSTISAAVAAAAAGDTIKVAPGTYKEQVTITKSLSLVALNSVQPTIDAAGKSNGIFINGMWAAPNPGVTNVLISGFKIENAKFEGILVVNASDVVIIGNHVFDNNKSLDIAG